MPALVDRLIERPRDAHHQARRHAAAFKVLAVVALIALALQTSLLFLSLFQEPLPYKIVQPGSEAIDSPEFLNTLALLTGGALSTGNTATVLTNGDTFYPAEIEAIRAARQFVHIECYIFQAGRVSDSILRELEQKAREGVQVRMVIDAVGSTAYPDSRFQALRAAGGRVAWYHRLRWYTWPRANNRTHREITVVDGTVGFAGGAGFADQWRFQVGKDPQWRDTVVRVQGGAAAGLDATFAENWLESTGEMLVDPKYFPAAREGAGATTALVVGSTPTSGRSTEARELFQSLLAKATRSIHINNPYFLPDKSLRQQMTAAVKRGVEVTVVVPGAKADHLLTRRSSRQLYGDLLLGGVRIFEYQPSMIHAKIMLVDGKWAVVGSTNLDSRSFGLNDEVNIAMLDSGVTAQLQQDFARDLGKSREIHYEEWKRRPWTEKAEEWFGWLLQYQQ